MFRPNPAGLVKVKDGYCVCGVCVCVLSMSFRFYKANWNNSEL